MKKTTQNVTKSICLIGLFAFVFLSSLSINSQTANQEYLVNPGVNSATGADSTTPDTGVDGSGNFPANLGGWTGGAGGAYAPTSVANGDCHSEDRMFKFNKVGGSAGHYVYQDVVNLPAGNFNWSFYTRWGAVVDYDADDAKKPTFTILTDDDADGTWEVVETIITTQPTAANTWVEQTGAFENDTPRDVRIRFHKDGGSNNAPSNLNQLMFIDDVSLKYESTNAFEDTSLSDLTIDGTTIAGFTKSGITYDIGLAQGTTVVPTVAVTTNNPNATAVITAATSIPGTTTIVITAEDGTTTNTVFVEMVEIPAITFSIDTNEIAEHQAATITATLSAPGPYDVEFDISSFSGTATEDDYVIASSYANGVRYIKFEAYYSSDSGQVNLNQIKALLSDGTNVACGKSGYANSYQGGGWDGNGSNVTNCNSGGRWSSERNDPGPSETEPHYIVVDLEEIYDLDSIEIVGDNWDMSFSVLVSDDDQNWTNIGTYTNYSLDQVVFMDPDGSGGFTIPSGETSVEIYVQGIEDNSTEGTESLTFEIPTVENANLLSPQEFTIDILDVVSSFTLIEDMFEGFSNAEFARLRTMF